MSVLLSSPSRNENEHTSFSFWRMHVAEDSGEVRHGRPSDRLAQLSRESNTVNEMASHPLSADKDGG
jgi:hypothetical protein